MARRISGDVVRCPNHRERVTVRMVNAALTGVVLAGGRAERMGGRDKGLLPLADEPLIAHVIRRLRPQVAQVVISANRHLEVYRQFGCPVIEDDADARYQGPLAGILAAMRTIDTPFLLVAPCDSPCLPVDYAQRMQTALRDHTGAAAVVVWEGFWQPVFALLSTTLQADLAFYLASGATHVGHWLRRQQPVLVQFSAVERFDNVNTPADLARMEAAWRADEAAMKRG